MEGIHVWDFFKSIWPWKNIKMQVDALVLQSESQIDIVLGWTWGSAIQK
jgi:hypothetical protein